MSHLYRECLCPSALVLTLDPLTCQSLYSAQNPAATSRLPPPPVLTPPSSVASGETWDLCEASINSLPTPCLGRRPPRTVALAFLFSQERHYLPSPESLPRDSFIGTVPALRGGSSGPGGPPSGHLKQHTQAPALQQLLSPRYRTRAGAGPSGPIAPRHHLQRDQGKVCRAQISMASMPAGISETGRTDPNPPLGKKKRFRDDGAGTHSTSPAGQGAGAGEAIDHCTRTDGR